MPSHIYYRIGRFSDSLDVNAKAIAADEAYIAGSKAQGLYPGAYYPHNLHFLMTSAQMGGYGQTAVNAAEQQSRAMDAPIERTGQCTHPLRPEPFFAHPPIRAPSALLAPPVAGRATTATA